MARVAGQLGAPALKAGSCVQIHGLASESGRQLNGQRGVVVQHFEAKGRFEVRLEQQPDRLVSLKPDNLRSPSDLAAAPEPAAPEPAKGSLASLLGMGRGPEAPKKAAPTKQPQWESLWSRNGSNAPSGTLSEEQMEIFRSMEAAQDEVLDEETQLRKKVKAELDASGVSDPTMLEAAFKEQWEQYKTLKILRPQDAKAFLRPASNARERSRSRRRR